MAIIGRAVVISVESSQKKEKKENELVRHTQQFYSFFHAIVGKAGPSPTVHTSMFSSVIAYEPAMLRRVTQRMCVFL